MLKKSILAVLSLLMLTACSDKDDELTAEERQQIIDDGTIGFEEVDGNVTKAENIPVDEEQAILAAFDEYIVALDGEDIERYLQVISKNPKGFDLDEDKEKIKEAFEKNDVQREVKDTVIIKYSENEAHVHAKITARLLEIETNAQLEDTRRQVTVFVKEDGNWKVTSIFAYSGDNPNASMSN
ncbi:DUF3225 domain-containing protein [Lysinibacillus sp. NPDC096418]|uniref:DUF3225 domain-containing protein n=1 Tax=Lysinibacillus sp. NPDC096418 TaxID=3364138 RepID=UPI00381E5D71